MIRNSRRVAALALGGALMIAPAVTGCGAGFTPETVRPSQPPQGLNFQIPQDTGKPALMEVRNLFVLGPADGQPMNPKAAAPVYGEFINSNPNGSADTLQSVTSSTFNQPSEITGGSVALPSNKLVSLNTGTAPLVVLKDLGQQLYAGQNVSLTLRFANAGEVTVTVPVVPWGGAYATYPPAPSATPAVTHVAATAGATASGSPIPGRKSPAPRKTETPEPTTSASASPTTTP